MNNNVMNPQKLMLDYVVVVLCSLMRQWGDVIELYQRMNSYEVPVRLKNSLVMRIFQLFSLMWVSLVFEYEVFHNLLCKMMVSGVHQQDQQVIIGKMCYCLGWNSIVMKEQVHELTNHV